MTAEQVLRSVVQERGIKVSHISQKTGIPYSRLLPSVQGKRELKADEWIALCVYLDLDPRDSLRGADKKENPA